ncbi:hypothetical protein NMG60_11026002 [Bertholletia excelsa]
MPPRSGATKDYVFDWCLANSFAIRLVVYFLILALLVIIITFIFKYLEHCGSDIFLEQHRVTFAPTETSYLIPKTNVLVTYGTSQEDLEASGKSSGSLSNELYDGKICIICYDQQRGCFFVPCGHSATCLVCAQKIVDGEGKKCPVCRRFIHRVRRLFNPQRSPEPPPCMQRD